MDKGGYVYILSNYGRTTIYIGVTSDIRRRIVEHREGRGSQFASRYKLNDLLYFETFPDIVQAIQREKQLKNWHSEWKWNLVKQNNPALADISETIW